AIRDGDGNADVHFGPVANVVVLEPGVARAVAHQGQGDGFDDDVVERNLPVFFAELLVERLASFGRALHVDLGRGEEVRDRANRRREPRGHRDANFLAGDV